MRNFIIKPSAKTCCLTTRISAMMLCRYAPGDPVSGIELSQR